MNCVFIEWQASERAELQGEHESPQKKISARSEEAEHVTIEGTCARERVRPVRCLADLCLFQTLRVTFDLRAAPSLSAS